MDINISEANQFIQLHAHPQQVGSNDLSLLNDWISKYPYCQSLHFLAAQATRETPEAEFYLAKASAFASNRAVLFQFVNQQDTFETEALVLDESFIIPVEITEVIEPQNDMGQAFGADLNYYKAEKSEAVAEEDVEIDNNVEEPQTGDLNVESENFEAVVGAEDDHEPVAENEEILEDEPAQEIEEITIEKEVEEPVQEFEVVKDEELAISEVEDIEEAEFKDVKAPLEDVEQVQSQEMPQQAENTEGFVEEGNIDALLAELKMARAKEDVDETDSVHDTKTEDNIEEAVEEIGESQEEEVVQVPLNEDEGAKSDETVQEVENTEESPVDQNEDEFVNQPGQTSEVEETEEVEKQQSEQTAQDIENVPLAQQVDESDIEIEAIPVVESVETAVDQNGEPLTADDTEMLEPVQESEHIEELDAEEVVEETEQANELQADEQTKVEENEGSADNGETQTSESNESVEKTIAEEAERSEKDELIFDNPVASDFFAFAKDEKPIEAATTPAELAKQEELPVRKPNQDVSQYNDERLPYTFLWWLNKTRKEHASNTQPYAKVENEQVVKRKNNAEDSLNHQIAENIFHLRGAEEILASKPQNQTVPFDFRRKEFTIIEKFIKEEPQIKPPTANKVDSENKAKQSSEDANQVVSETLAKIYVEQMLYHKALDVYKKLSLKYPEKSTYFASQIKYLELKVN